VIPGSGSGSSFILRVRSAFATKRLDPDPHKVNDNLKHWYEAVPYRQSGSPDQWIEASEIRVLHWSEALWIGFIYGLLS
jgi:hypothetical protein